MSEMPDWISSLSDNEARQVSVDLSQVMSSAAERVHYAESRRSNFAAIAAGLFAGAIALASMAVQESFKSASWALWVLAAGFFTLSVLLFYVYSKQVNRYPWTAATKTWKWFYRDALPNQANFDHSFFRWLFRWRAEVVKARAEFDHQLPGFAQKIRTVRDERESLWQDVQQIYVLHVNEKYKNAYLSRLRTILSSGLVVILLAMVIATAAQHLIPRKGSGAGSLASSPEVSMSWVKYEGAACKKECWLVNLQISNRTGDSFLVKIDGLGTKCLELPGSYPIAPIRIGPRSTHKSSAYLGCGVASPSELKLRVLKNAG